MSREASFFKKLDWATVAIYLLLVGLGWISIFASIYDAEYSSLSDIFDTSRRYGMQLRWIGGALVIAVLCLCLQSKYYPVLAWPLYILSLLSLIAVLFFGVEVNGSTSWLDIGGFRLQPAEFAKIAASLALARLLSEAHFKLRQPANMLLALAVIFIPPIFIIMEHEAGLALVYTAFLLVFYREGMSGWVLVLGFCAICLFLLSILWEKASVFILITSVCSLSYGLLSRRWLHLLIAAIFFVPAYIYLPSLLAEKAGLSLASETWFLLLLLPFLVVASLYSLRKHIRSMGWVLLCFFISVGGIYSVDYVFDNVLRDHQRTRIQILLGLTQDLQGAGYNVHQSKVAIGSGGLSGKGFLQGTQTKYNFVPEQDTDFIFCTVGEEWGFLGACVLILLYLALFYRIILIAERHKDSFVRIYGYCVATCFFFHFFINIGMTIGMVPVIGIPLPFISYGGSSLWAFTVLLFILLKLDSNRWG
jgi:Bacterial cell division membrane protein